MRSRQVAGCLLAVGALALACGGDEERKPSGPAMGQAVAEPAEEREANQAPLLERVVLDPPEPLPGQRIEARIEVSDPDGDAVRLSIEWRHNGRVISSGRTTQLKPEGLAKGDRLEVIVKASDGRDESAPVRVSATVSNRTPLISALALAPDGEVRPGQEVTAVPQAMDPDGDPLDYEFEWLLDGKPVRGADEAAFDTSSLKRGDRLAVRVRVSDGEEWSPVAESPVLELANRPPMIAGVPPIESAGGGITAQLEAEDPDGDRSLRFRVLEGPKGLSVDPVSGRLSWRPAPGTIGTQPVEIAVADSFGAESALRFELTVSAPGDEKPAPPPAKAEAADDGALEDADEAVEPDELAEPDEAEPEDEEGDV
jgi:hypothetical protein